ncbi:MAG: hypothetical protein ACI4UH_00935 [Dorea sp.]
MAARQTSRYERQNNYESRQMYVYGNVVTKPSYEPQKHTQEPRRKTSHQVRRNRKKALQMSPGYVVFLAVAAIIALVICVNYVQLQSRITSRSKNITAMQKELAQLREENNTRYNVVMDTVNLEEVREKAEKMGMEYATSSQIVTYQSPSADYVKQYESIPEDGVLAQSRKNE